MHYVYHKNHEPKLVATDEEYEALLATGEWFDRPQTQLGENHERQITEGEKSGHQLLGNRSLENESPSASSDAKRVPEANPKKRQLPVASKSKDKPSRK